MPKLTSTNDNPLISLCQQGIKDGVFPGASFACGTKDEMEVGCVGHYTYDVATEPITPDSLFDLASVTKVVGTTTAAMLLFDDGKLELDKKVATYVPGFEGDDRAQVTVRNLLMHDSGLPAYADLSSAKTPVEARSKVLHLKMNYPTGSKSVYSCMGFITLQQVIEALEGQPLDQFLKKRVWDPLGMRDTMYRPPEAIRNRCVPTEKDAKRGLIQGEVHDPAAFFMGGVSGNAGLFSTATDLAKFCRMMLSQGSLVGHQIVCASTIDNWTHKQEEKSTRGLGWDTKSETGSSAGHKFSMHAFGHTGYTGTTVWIDPENGIFCVLLTNRVYPTSENLKIAQFRPKFHDAVFDHLMGR